MQPPCNAYTFESAIRPRLERASSLAGDLITSAVLRRPDGGGEAALKAEINAIARRIMMRMEDLGLLKEIPRFRGELSRLKGKGSHLVVYDSDNGHLICPPLLCIERWIDLILAKSGLADGGMVYPTSSMRHLESILESTPCILRDRGIIPARESDITHVMRQTLSYAFPDTTSEFTIGGSIKSFRPDMGIPSLRMAVEYKLLGSREGAGDCIDGIFADMVGYSGSAEWSGCIWVIYQTEAFLTQGRVDAMCAEKSIPPGCRVMVVTGGGER